MYCTLVVLLVASFSAIFVKAKNAKSSNFIEFEADVEAGPTKESKKAIKKTLANIMRKNNASAKVSLIQ